MRLKAIVFEHIFFGYLNIEAINDFDINFFDKKGMNYNSFRTFTNSNSFTQAKVYYDEGNLTSKFL